MYNQSAWLVDGLTCKSKSSSRNLGCLFGDSMVGLVETHNRSAWLPFPLCPVRLSIQLRFSGNFGAYITLGAELAGQLFCVGFNCIVSV